MNEWAQAKSSFASLKDEADAVVRMFDQERKHIVGLSQALSQIQDSFDKLHSRFTDVEGRVESFENINGRLTYRLEATFDALQEVKTSEAELTKNQLELRAALDAVESKWAQQLDRTQALADENRLLRDALAATERDNKLLVAEIASIHSKITLLEQQVEHESLFVRPEVDVPRSAQVTPERAFAVQHDPKRILQAAAPDAALDDEVGQADHEIADLDESIAYHKTELGRIQAQAETLMAELAEAPAHHRPPAGRVDHGRTADRGTLAQSAHTASERKLSELQALSSSYHELLQGLEKSRAALAARRAAPDEPAEDAVTDEGEPPRLRSASPLAAAGSAEFDKINSMRSMFEKRTEDLKAELMQERRERKFAECALRVARAERLHLQHELAKVRAMGWRKISADASPEPAPPREPEAVKRRFTAA